LSPKIVECGRHLNIETITWSQLEELSGDPGDYTVKIRKRARYVDMDKCTGCGECAEVCPVILSSEFDADMGQRRAIFRPCPQAYPNTFVIDKTGKSPCSVGCPAGININGYIALTAEGKFDEALDVILETVPLAGVLGRICDHPCELECHLGRGVEPVSICAVKRFLADHRRNNKLKAQEPATPDRQTLAKVAVIGSGPAGLTAARDLARKGYQPVIFEALSTPGGMLAWGIPDYRLPPDILQGEIQDVLDEGVELRLNSRLGKDFTLQQLRKQGFKAVILAIGAHAGGKLRIEGEQLDGVTDCIAFLHQANKNRKLKVGKHVTVVGGGNSAVDSARTALRLGAEKVTIVYRRSRSEMPAIPAEIEDALREGINILYLAAPLRLTGKDTNVSAMECVKMRLGEPDESGRRRPIPIEGSAFKIQTDMVISAIGQEVVWPEDSDLKKLNKTRWSTIEAHPSDTSTNIDGVFAIGDAVTGPKSVIEAIGQGRKAAQAVDCYLRNVEFEPLNLPKREDVTTATPIIDIAQNASPRQQQSHLPADQRIKTFEEVEQTLSQEQAQIEAKRCLNCAGCSECQACVRICKAEAILHNQQDVIEDINVGAVVVLPGYEDFLAWQNYDFGYSQYDDVVTSMQFERILSASGPFAGHVQRPSDGKTPKKIAFLQCIGSRDISCRNDYCSSVCCMYAIKEAVIAKEHTKGLDVTVFFMDMRAFGKDFDKYYERAKAQYGVKFKRARVSDVTSDNGQLNVRYSPSTGGTDQEQFDMVVLSTGLEQDNNLRLLAEKLGVKVEPHGFVWTDPMKPLATSRPGIFVGGVASGPKDIPETVTQASATAAEVATLLADVRNTLTIEQEFPPQRDVSAEPPKIGVFVCHCGINIGGTVDVPAATEYAKTLPHVAYAEENLYTCSQDTQDHIKEIIEQYQLNRVVVASCSPRTHEPLFQQTLRQAGLNPNLFEMANIRDQCSWVHMNDPEKATQKSMQLIAMAVAKVTIAQSLHAESLPVTPSALVVGGGLAGMTAAIAIANAGFDVALTEKSKVLGGNLNKLNQTFNQPDIKTYLRNLIETVEDHPHITVYRQAELQNVDGFVGNFETTIQAAGKEETIKHGVIIVATGGSEHKPEEYLFGQNKNIITQLQLEETLQREEKTDAKSVVMIQCVGSRQQGHMYCSRLCCSQAVKNALMIKERSPQTTVYILYRDMRTYGFDEQYYQKARDKGIVFIRYDQDDKPQVSNNGSLKVTVADQLLARRIVLNADMLVLSSRIDANSGNEKLAQLLKVPINEDSFFLEAHVKLRPVEFATEGIFVAGLAHSPKSITETIAQAKAAAAKACTIITKETYQGEPRIAHVDISKCTACETCIQVCAYKAIEIVIANDRTGAKAAYVNPALCKGCGTCAATCRCGAVDIKGISDHQIDMMIKTL